MATKIIGQGPTRRTAAEIHAHAISVLNESAEDRERLYAVAAAGAKLCRDDNRLFHHLFSVIEDLTADCTLIGSLRRIFNELAQAAGSTSAEDSDHA